VRHSLVVLLLGGALMAQPPPVRDVYADTWVATDGLGRVLPTAAECGSPRPDKVVGIFYFLWLGNHTTVLHDITQILAADPANPPWGPLHAFHHWGRPRLGYYFMDDPFVIEKHAQMLTDAGVDVVFLDVTNAVTYDATVQRVGEVYTRLRAAGRPTPQFAFLCHSKEGEVAQRLYDTWYAPGKFRELWFLWRGRPLILAKPEALSESLRQYFEVRESWAWTGPESWFGDGRDKWPWLDDYPQKPGWHAAPDQPEQLTVAVASHPTRNIGRSFHNGAQPPPDQVQPDQGLFFAEQWRRVAEVDPQVVFITGWNEWVAQRFTRPEQGGPAMMAGRPLRPGDSFFVDAYTQEFSRDIEPMAGGHGDQYYYQMVAGIRRFKGVRPGPVAGPPLSAPPGLAAADWAPVGPEYRDAAGDLPRRDFRGFGDEHYRNDTGRNDILLTKVARDTANLYFLVECAAPLTPPDGSPWMWLLLDLDGRRETGWEGYDFIVNHGYRGGERTTVARHIGGRFAWQTVGEATLRCEGARLLVTVPRALLGVGADPLTFDFKWADNLPADCTAADFIDQGEVAPSGRFNYRYRSR